MELSKKFPCKGVLQKLAIETLERLLEIEERVCDCCGFVTQLREKHKDDLLALQAWVKAHLMSQYMCALLLKACQVTGIHPKVFIQTLVGDLVTSVGGTTPLKRMLQRLTPHKKTIPTHI